MTRLFGGYVAAILITVILVIGASAFALALNALEGAIAHLAAFVAALLMVGTFAALYGAHRATGRRDQ